MATARELHLGCGDVVKLLGIGGYLHKDGPRVIVRDINIPYGSLISKGIVVEYLEDINDIGIHRKKGTKCTIDEGYKGFQLLTRCATQDI